MSLHCANRFFRGNRVDDKAMFRAMCEIDPRPDAPAFRLNQFEGKYG